MKYHVWLVTESDEKIRVVSTIATNKKTLRGKWQIFVKEAVIKYSTLSAELIGYRLKFTNDEGIIIKFNVYDDRNDLVYKKKGMANKLRK
jgi:hypothetical protein